MAQEAFHKKTQKTMRMQNILNTTQQKVIKLISKLLNRIKNNELEIKQTVKQQT